MIIIRPIAVTDAILAASDIPETDHPAYNAGTTYALGDRVISTATHRIYRSLQAGNAGNALTDPDWWLDERATNRWRMFDRRIADPSTRAGSINITLAPTTLVNAIAFFGLSASTLEVTVTDSVEGVVYQVEHDLTDNSMIDGYYSWFFEPIVRKTEAVFLDLPAYVGADIAITLTAASGDAKVGEIVLGNQRRLGDALLGTAVGIQSFSRKERDEFGNWYVVPRGYSDTAEFPVSLPNSQIGPVKRLLAEYHATPVVFVGKDDGGWGTLVYGYYQDFQIVIPTNVISDCNLVIEGLT